MNKKVPVLGLILAFCLAYSMQIGPINGQSWSNITCRDGLAYKVYNITFNNEPFNISENEICGPLGCLNGTGCVKPNDTPGEVFLGAILFFVLIAFIFGYFSIRVTAKEYTPMRILFFFLSFIMVMSGVFMTYEIFITLGYTTLSGPFLATLGVFLGVFIFLIWYQVIPFLKWAVKKLMTPKSEEEVTDVIS